MIILFCLPAVAMTESFQLLSDQIYMDKLSNLFATDRPMFDQVMEYMPIMYSCSTVDQWKHVAMNEALATHLKTEKEYILKCGPEYTTNMVRPDTVSILKQGISQFKYESHGDRVLSYTQFIKPPERKEYSLLRTHKKFLNENLYMNMYQVHSGAESIFQSLYGMIGPAKISVSDYQRYHSLTNREKQVFFLVIQGTTNREVAYQLNISPNTVRTHRNRVWKKLNIRHFRDCQKYELFMNN